MSRSHRSARCSKCRIIKQLCFCNKIESLDTVSKVSVIMHVSERKLTTNTANWIDLTLSNSTIFTRGEKESRFVTTNCLDDLYTPLYLYPDHDAKILDKTFLEGLKGPFNLIIPDGSWRQAAKVKAREKALQDVVCVKLKDVPRSSYRLRKAPSKESLCTYEACMYALREIESEEVFNKMSCMFSLMVGSILQARSGAILGSEFLR